jgi:hypothetical protein
MLPSASIATREDKEVPMRRARLLSLLVLTLLPGLAGLGWAQGDPLGPEFRVNAYTTSRQSMPSVAADTTGNFVVVWQSNTQDGSGYGSFGQRYSSSGIPLGPEFRVNTYTTGLQAFASVAADPSGNFVVVWASPLQDGSGDGVFGQRYVSSGAPVGPEFRVNSYTTFAQTLPAVAADGSGAFVVVWISYLQDGSAYGIFGQRYASSGAPVGPEFRVNGYTPQFQVTPTVAADASGNFVVAWVSFPGQDGQGLGVFAQRYASSGAPLGPEFRVNTYTTENEYSPSVAADSSGNFVVAWVSNDQDGYGRGIFGQRYASSGAPLAPEFRVNTYTSYFQYHPAVASDASGNFVVVWQSYPQKGFSYGIFGQRYASSGTPLGSEFRVNTFTTYNQLVASVGADSAGDFVVVWGSNLQDGSNDGVFGQRYSQIVPVELMYFRVE